MSKKTKRFLATFIILTIASYSSAYDANRHNYYSRCGSCDDNLSSFSSSLELKEWKNCFEGNGFVCGVIARLLLYE